MSASCQFINVGAQNECKENYSGIGTSVYIFSGDDLAHGFNPEYEDGKAEYTEDSFTRLPVHRIAIKSQSGKITHQANANAGGFNNIFTGLVANDMEKMALMARTMNNLQNWGLLIPDGAGKMYVIYAKDFDLKFEMSGDTGDTPDSDHGHTLVVTAGPCRYPFVKWNGYVEKTGEDTYTAYSWNDGGHVPPWHPDDEPSSNGGSDGYGYATEDGYGYGYGTENEPPFMGEI